MAKIKLMPDGAIIEIENGTTGAQLAKSKGLAKVAAVAKIDGALKDLDVPLPNGSVVEIIRVDAPEGLEVLRHSAAHLTAQAVRRVYPQARLAIGPVREDRYYYEFGDVPPFSPDDLAKFEAIMKEVVKEDFPTEHRVVTPEEAREIFQDEPFKLELIDKYTAEGQTLTVYKQGEFIDLCRGPHMPSTGAVKAFKLLSASSAYWLGDERNPSLQRIWGTAFPGGSGLQEYLKKIEEAEKRDHRKLGVALDLFSTADDEVGGGLVLWHPKGALVRKLIEDFWRDEHLKHGYHFAFTPHIGRAKLWQTSGHLDFYAENMYAPIEIEEQQYYLKPMNCPFHMTIYRAKRRSYRELPLRIAELGTVYRFERSGVLHGLMRVRGFTQDDAHLFVPPEIMEDEVIRVIDFVMFMLRSFGFTEFEAYVATRPEKAVGEQAEWDRATEALKQAATKAKLRYEMDEGGGAFYGPKIDIKIKDSLGRAWQCSTIQFDFNLPEKFNINYIGPDGQNHRPFVIHRALLGSLERFFGVLIEHYGGAFPVWLAPVQAVVIPVAEEYDPYARRVEAEMRAAGLRVELDSSQESLNKKIRTHQLGKIPYILVVGRQEMTDETVSVRRHGQQNTDVVPLPQFVEWLADQNVPGGRARQPAEV